MKVFQKVRLLNYRIAGNFCGVFISAILRFLSATAELTSILRVLLKAIQSPTDPNKFKSATIISPSKIQKMNFEQRAITHEKVGQPWRKSNLICNSSYGSLLLTFSQICESIAKKSPENEFWTAITHEKVGQPWQKSNLICNSSYGSLLPTFIQICESIAKKSPEN